MLATARALCAQPRLLLLDEPTEGLMPALVQRLLETIGELRARGVGILLVEQRIDAALRVVDRVVLLETGRVRHEATPAELAATPRCSCGTSASGADGLPTRRGNVATLERAASPPRNPRPREPAELRPHDDHTRPADRPVVLGSPAPLRATPGR